VRLRGAARIGRSTYLPAHSRGIGATIVEVTRRISSPELVDRSDALALLTSAWREAAAGRPRVVLVRGEAGIGKTRLVAAFESGAPAAALVLHGACVRLGTQAAAFTPFRGLLGELVERWGPDRVRALAAGAASTVSALVPDLAGSSDPEAGDTYDAVARLLDRASREQPLALVVEDVHWADNGTLAMVDYLSRALRSSRLLMIITLRAGMGDRSPADSLVAELMTLGRVDTVDVSPLSATGVRHQLRGILGRPPPAALAERIVTRSQGVPFLVEELAAAEAEGEHGIPESMRDVLLLRTAGLSATAIAVLRAVALAGRPVDEATLVAVCDLDLGAVDAALGELRDASLLVLDRAAGTVDVRHALLREAVESQLVPGEAWRLHRRYAELLDAAPAEIGSHLRAIEAADHWWLAGDLGQARRAALDAARAAHAVGLYREADLDVGQRFKNFYEETKFLAEKIVAESGLPSTIYRPGIVVGDSRTGATAKFDGPYFALNAMRRLPSPGVFIKVGTGQARVNLVPIDFVMEALAQLASWDGAIGKTYHLTDPKPLTAGEIEELFAKALGKQFVYVPVPSLLARAAFSPGPVQKLLHMPVQTLDYFDHPVEYDCRQATAHLAQFGVQCPWFVDYAQRLISFYTENVDRIQRGAMI